MVDYQLENAIRHGISILWHIDWNKAQNTLHIFVFLHLTTNQCLILGHCKVSIMIVDVG